MQCILKISSLHFQCVQNSQSSCDVYVQEGSENPRRKYEHFYDEGNAFLES